MATNEKSTFPSLVVVLGVVVYASIVLNFSTFFRETLVQPFSTKWSTLISTYDFQTLGILGAALIPLFVYYGLGLLFLIIDMTGKPKWILKYKVQDPTPAYPIPLSKVYSVLKVVLFNQLFLQVPLAILNVVYMTPQDVIDKSVTLPSLTEFFKDFFMFVVFEEIFFYYGHRMLHHPSIYKFIHKKHHEWQAPIALTAVYCHPFEHLLSNIFPVAFGPLFMRSNLFTSWFWFALTSTTAIISHSGYHLPLLPSPEYHDYHHLKFTQNFGVMGWLDWIHGTDSIFRQTKAYERHILLLSLVPAKQLIPDS